MTDALLSIGESYFYRDVAARSGALATLSRDIANILEALSRKAPAR